MYGAVFVELLIDVLHFDNDSRALVSGAINVEDGTSLTFTRAEVLTVLERYIRYDAFAVKNGVEEADKQFLVELRAEDTLESEVCQWVDIFFRCL